MLKIILFFDAQKKNYMKKNNSNFLGLIEMITEFDSIMQEYVRRIKSGELHA